MRHTCFLLGLVLFLTATASAQSNSTQPLLLTTPTLSLSSALMPAPAAPFSIAPGTMAPAANSSSPGAAAPPPQGVQGVFVNYSWQAYIGYTFYRFYVNSNTQENQNGFNYSMAYYFKDWFALDGEFAATHGNLHGDCSWFLFGGGGPRFRWSAPHNLEIWGHALFGGAHFSPRTAFGNQEAFAYTVGGGVDINAHHWRLAYRVGADMVASHFFSTYQYSPKFFAGIVFKF
jgi:hypothetical protein